jgi:predicted TIM-barrel fold metal-dependent hydrolase
MTDVGDSDRPLGPSEALGLLVDCDVHNILSDDVLEPWLPARWREHKRRYGGRDLDTACSLPRIHPLAARTDSWPPSGLPPGADLNFMRQQLLDEWHIHRAILFTLGISADPNPLYAAALARAENDCVLEEWLKPEPRLRGSLSIAWEDPDAAVAEIARVGEHPAFVQIAARCRMPGLLGNRRYWRIYAAAVELGLPIGVHFGGWSSDSPTGSGPHTFYSEEKGGIATIAQDQLISLVCEGVFERFPDLKIVFIENGFAWLPALMWRLDRAWRKLKDEVPHLRRLPSEYVRDHVWTTTQPIEQPPSQTQFLGLLEQMDMDDHIMFATDYPHWDFDAPDRALPSSLSSELRAKIEAGNANRLYHLGLAIK